MARSHHHDLKAIARLAMLERGLLPEFYCPAMSDYRAYDCAFCGEENSLLIDPHGGRRYTPPEYDA